MVSGPGTAAAAFGARHTELFGLNEVPVEGQTAVGVARGKVARSACPWLCCCCCCCCDHQPVLPLGRCHCLCRRQHQGRRQGHLAATALTAAAAVSHPPQSVPLLDGCCCCCWCCHVHWCYCCCCCAPAAGLFPAAALAAQPPWPLQECNPGRHV